MQKCVAVLVSLLFLLPAAPSAHADAYHAKPKLAVILVIVVGTIRLIGSNANNVFSNVASSIQ